MSELESLVAGLMKDLGPQLGSARLGREYYYCSLTLPVIDAVYSAQAVFASVENVVMRYCETYQIVPFREPEAALPVPDEQDRISDMLARMRHQGVPYFVETVFNNRSQTSGRFKAEIVLDLLNVLEGQGIQTLQDIQATLRHAQQAQKLVEAIVSIHGIGEATYRYFLMLAGDEQLVKPDTMILRYLKLSLGRSVREAEAVQLIQTAARSLNLTYPHLTPRLLDYLIWSYQRRAGAVLGTAAMVQPQLTGPILASLKPSLSEQVLPETPADLHTKQARILWLMQQLHALGQLPMHHRQVAQHYQQVFSQTHGDINTNLADGANPAYAPGFQPVYQRVKSGTYTLA